MEREFQVGVESMDTEHAVERGLVRGLEEAVRLGKTRAEVGEMVDGLASYLEAHFLSEQLLMRLHAFPEYEDHLQEHDRAVEMLVELKRRHEQGHADLTLEVIASLRGWLEAHIRDRDAALARFLGFRGAAPA